VHIDHWFEVLDARLKGGYFFEPMR
jgi:hypothetical protein